MRMGHSRLVVMSLVVAWLLVECDAFLAQPNTCNQPTTTSSHCSILRDARGAAIWLEDVTIYRGTAEIVSNIHWRIEPRTKWGLIGSNGAGKSTLLQAMSGNAKMDYEGTIHIGPQQRIGYLQQTAVGNSHLTVYEEAVSGMTELNRIKRDMELAQEHSDLDALTKLQTRFEGMGGYQVENRIANVLNGLGFTNFTTPCQELSGGWQMRVAFARQLLSEHSIALLDEPGNHLDATAKHWLANYLKTYDGDSTLVLVTHDVELLESMQNLAEIVPGQAGLQIYKSCTYQQYLDLKQQRIQAAQSEYEKNSEKAAKLQAFVDRFGASATKASAAQSRVKQLEKLRDAGLLDAPSMQNQRFQPVLVLAEPARASGDSFVRLEGANVGYDRVLVENVALEIVKGMKLLIRGPNGSGKTTTLVSVQGSLPLLDGVRVANPDVRLGIFTQDLAQELDPSARAVDLVTQYARTGQDGDIFVSDQQARSVLGQLGLQGEKALRKLQFLSGGEKARVALAMFALKPSNVICLDEPSNHLDSECVHALGKALNEWGEDHGAVVVVSHDRNFCKLIDFSHVATVQDGKLTLEQRGARSSDWIQDGSLQSTVASRSTETADAATTLNSNDISPINKDPQLRRKAFNAPKRISKLEALIERSEGEVAELEQQMLENGTDVGLLVDLTKQKEVLQGRIDEYMDEWAQLEEILAQVA